MHLTVEEDLRRSGIVEISLIDGRSASRRVDAPLGHLTNPMPRDALIAKFLDCAGHAATEIPRENLERVIDLVDHLEQVGDVAIIADLLSGRS